MIFGLVITQKNTDGALRDSGRRIRCPKCEWEPSKHDRWHCDDACGHVWNTFETSGRCPACQKQWRETACLRCGIWSPHDEWYVAE
jgi:hypothetical protein